LNLREEEEEEEEREAKMAIQPSRTHEVRQRVHEEDCGRY
jgi:hypothetical protein